MPEETISSVTVPQSSSPSILIFTEYFTFWKIGEITRSDSRVIVRGLSVEVVPFHPTKLYSASGVADIVTVSPLLKTPPVVETEPPVSVLTVNRYSTGLSFLHEKSRELVLSENFFNHPYEVVFRSLSDSLKMIGKKYYYARGKKIDYILDKLKKNTFKKETLAGCVVKKVNKTIIITKENQFWHLFNL